MSEQGQREWATMREELERKAMEVLHEAAFKHLEEASMSKEVFDAVCKTLIDTISGLAGWDCTNVVIKVRKELCR